VIRINGGVIFAAKIFLIISDSSSPIGILDKNQLTSSISQCPRTDLNKNLYQRLPQHEILCPIDLISAKIEILHIRNFLSVITVKLFLKIWNLILPICEVLIQLNNRIQKILSNDGVVMRK
jgi:hypothetical protein